MCVSCKDGREHARIGNPNENNDGNPNENNNDDVSPK